MDPICTWLFSMWIVGAVETSPGWMKVDHLDPVSAEVLTSVMRTEEYLSCFPSR